MDFTEAKARAAEEIRQRRDEGADVAAWQAEYDEQEARRPEDTAWAALYERLCQSPFESPSEDREPSALDAIRARRPDGPRSVPVEPSTMDDRLLGAWQGRVAGCILGKPVESWPKARVDRYLAAAGLEDLDTFFPLLDPWPETVAGEPFPPPVFKDSMEGCIRFAERDDDIDYTILGLHYVEAHGPDFTAKDVADEWLNLLPYHQVFTAERVAYANLVNGLQPPESATYRNPYREWIGAQIRADAFGYIRAGNPERAAAMAFQDASVSHTRNGIYGEMWSAAMIAAAFGARDPRHAIEAGLAEIPQHSRLAEAGRRILAWSREFATWEECWARAQRDFGEMSWVHTINNACWVMIGLLYGGMDFGRTIAIAVRCGDDTDCNGATAGSVIGAMLGAKRIPRRWVSPFNDRVRSYVVGFDNSRITDLAARTHAQWKRVSAG